LAANLAAAEVCCVHVGIGQTVAHGFQSRVEIARVNAQRRGPGDICCRNGSRDGSFSCRRTRRLTAAAAQKITTPPATLPGAKCRWATLRGGDKSENVNENVIVPC
jgi:hypothetical protein